MKLLIPLTVALAVLSAGIPAQFAVLNNGSAAPNAIVSTFDPGGAITVDLTNFQIGQGSLSRAIGAANTAYLDTEIPVNVGVASPGDSGWTIQFWYRPLNATTFGYIFGDSGMNSPLGGASGGRFRLFQSGTSGVTGGLTLRGVPNECASGLAGALIPFPLTTAINSAGWVHIAFRYDPTPQTIDMFINGTLNISVAQTSPMNWTTTDARGLAIIGDRGTNSAVGNGNYDDWRIYNYARCNADILNDYNMPVNVPGTTSCGKPFLPDLGYFEFEGGVDSHIAHTAISFDPLGPQRRRRFIAGTILNWSADSPTLPSISATAFINIIPGGGEPGCFTPGIAPGFKMCHFFNSPIPAVLFPDGLGIGSALGVSIPLPFVYGASPPVQVAAPFGLVGGATGGLNGKPLTGDEIHIQWVAAPSPGYPLNIGVSNITAFSKIDSTPGGHVSAEIRGVGAINVLGFFRVHNVGTKDIAQVVIDTTPLVTVEFLSSGALNTGGTLSAGSSYRFGSEVECSLANFFGGGIGVTLGGTPNVGGDAQILTFDFDNAGGPLMTVPAPGQGDGFSAATDSFVFDTETVPANTNGNSFIGATLTVTFTDMTTVSGPFVADPTDPTAAVIDL